MSNESESGPDPRESVGKDEFNNWLINKISRQSTMVSRAYGEKIIQYLREERENGPDSSEVKAKHTSSFRFQVKKRKFQLINVVGLGDILCLPIKDKTKSSHAMLGQHRQVIFKEDMFDVINSAHVNGERHRGYKGTFKKINATYCNIPREVVSKFVTMCKFCRKAHACFAPNSVKNGTSDKNKQKKKKDLTPKKKEIEMNFLTRCQVDILDMQSFPDIEGRFSYIAHFLDHHTKYNVLIPLKRTDAFYVAKKLCRYVFGHFGLPHIIHSNLGRKYVDDIIGWILQLWSTDAQILNGNPRFKKMNTLIQQRQKTIMMLIETIRAKQADVSNWSSWLPGIQYSLNTNQFEPESPPSYYVVYTRRPKVYTYAPSSKEIPREEDVVEESVSDETPVNVNEVITVSMSDLLQNASADTILISQLQGDTNGLDQGKDLHQAELKGTTLPAELLNSSALGGIPLSLGEQQYTIIGTNLGVDGQTIQIPVVNIGSRSLTMAVQGNPTSSMNQTKTMIETVDSNGVRTTLQLHDGTSLSLTGTNNGTLELTHPNANSLGLANHQNESPLSLNSQDDDSLGLGNQVDNPLGLNNQVNNSLGLNNQGDNSLVLNTQDDNSLDLSSLDTNNVTDSLEIPNLKIEVLDSNTNEVVDDTECYGSKQTSSQFTMATLENELNEGERY